MSLLIKALEQAAESRNAGDKVELSLEPLAKNDATLAESNSSPKYSQKTASTVFSAKKNSQPKPLNKLAWVALATLILLLAAIAYFYWYWQSLTAPEIVIAKPVSAENMAQAQAVENQPEANTNLEAAAAPPIDPPLQKPPKTQEPEDVLKVEPLVTSSLVTTSLATTNKTKQNAVASTTPKDEATLNHPTTNPTNSRPIVFGEPASPADDGNVKVTKTQPAASINPKLIEAYNAYAKGDDAQAQQAYREVLKGDVRNTDALLGMATIAARQGRNDDAVGWYKKVLETEPRNHIAMAGVVNLQQQDDPVSAETRLKNMISQQPESASLYASLGDFYVSQNQWSSAQQAYFQAYHFEPNNVQHMFNLAVSLDHMGKPKLALPYYKQALDLATSTGTASVDRTKLESRISQLSQ